MHVCKGQPAAKAMLLSVGARSVHHKKTMLCKQEVRKDQRSDSDRERSHACDGTCTHLATTEG